MARHILSLHAGLAITLVLSVRAALAGVVAYRLPPDRPAGDRVEVQGRGAVTGVPLSLFEKEDAIKNALVQ